MRIFDEIRITDPMSSAKSSYNKLDQVFLGLIRDARDLPFVYLTLRITFYMILPGILLFFVQGWIWWILAAWYFYLNNLYYKGPFGLMLHCTSHRPFFRKKYHFLNYYLPWIMAPFFGHTPETYFIHHIGMHHAENNLEEDESSTMQYQRDSFRDFMAYFTSFLFKGAFELYRYHQKRKRKNFLTRMVAGEVSFYLMVIALSFVNFPATLVVFILPFLIFRFITMMGNWAQHTFVDPEDPANLYKSSITCINVKYNHKCWNDGYHISHHIRPNMHWTEHPAHLLEHRGEYARHQAIIFDGLDFLKVFVLVMRKKYDVLADHLVNIDGAFASREEAIATLKKRTAKIPVVQESAALQV